MLKTFFFSKEIVSTLKKIVEVNVKINSYAYQMFTFLKNQKGLRFYTTNSNHHANKKQILYLGQMAIFSQKNLFEILQKNFFGRQETQNFWFYCRKFQLLQPTNF